MIRHVYSLPRRIKTWLLLMADGVLVVVSFYLALALRLSEIWPANWIASSTELLLVLLVSALALSVLLQTHRVKISNFDVTGFGRLALWALLLTLIGILVNIPLDPGAPRTVPVIFGIIVVLLAGSLRLAAQFVFMSRIVTPHRNRQPVAIYGAGQAGMQLINALRRSSEYRPVVILDDNSQLHGVYMFGLRVIDPDQIVEWVAKGNVSKVLLAIPSLGNARKRQILKELAEVGCELLELPSYVDMIRTGGVIDSLKPVKIEDLLNREYVDLDLPEFEAVYSGKNILVSGAGGSIGSELCRKLVSLKPRKLCLLDSSEFALYSIEKELRELASENNIELISMLGSVQDTEMLDRVFLIQEIEIVLHAAAYKHVPLVEINEIEGAKNNILGTMRIAEAAARNGVKRFTLISTDKAVRPTNFMGASKRMAEIIVQELQKQHAAMICSIVRFGNVLGSSGSVVPLFREQIRSGGPVTVTHPEVTRYFMTIPEAARLVLLAATYAEGGDVFVLDMGEPVKIIDLAKRMITMSGLSVRSESNPDGDIEIVITGLRPGEKLYEELLIGEGKYSTPHSKIMRANEFSNVNDRYTDLVGELISTCDTGDADKIRKFFQKYVIGYRNIY